VGLIRYFLVKPVGEEHHMNDEALARRFSQLHEAPHLAANADRTARGSLGTVGVLAQALVRMRFLTGEWIVISKVAALI
jgi:hypothetical protein